MAGGCLASYTSYDDEGKTVGAGNIFMPDYLDWLPIEVKAFWFRTVGHGPPATRYVLFISQGEQRLLFNVSLQQLDYKTHKEKTNGDVRSKVEDFIEKGGYSRVPRNQ